MGLFLFLIGVMPLWSTAMFFIGDYYKTVDVRMMKFFTEMSTATLWFLVVLGVLSLLYKNVWCRWLCPYGALLGLLSRLSPFKVRRNAEQCVGCHACTKHCPTLIDVEHTVVVKSAECFGCMTCVSHCPVPGALELTVKTGKTVRTIQPWVFPLVLVALFYLVIGIGMATDTWQSKVPYEDYKQLIPEVQKEYQNR
jgi:MinD superfamily P-loop ATPase